MINLNHRCTEISSSPPATATGTQFTITNTAGTTYLIYALSSISLKATATSSTAGTIQATGAYTGVLRVVMLAQSSHKALLDQYYQNYPTSVGIDYSFTTTTGTLLFNWNVVGNGANLLMLTWPHHRTTMQSPNFPATSSLAYLTTKVGDALVFGSDYSSCHLIGIHVPCPRQSVEDAVPAHIIMVEPSSSSRLVMLFIYHPRSSIRDQSTERLERPHSR